MSQTQFPTEDELCARVAQCPEDLRRWAEQEGHLNLAEHIEISTAISAQASATLTVLLAGLGATMTYAAKVFEPGHAGPVAWGAAAMCAYLVVVAALLVLRNIRLEDVPMRHNQPGCLLMPGETAEAVRMGELVNIEMRIRDMRSKNVRRALALNQVRAAAVASPVVFAVAAAVAARL